ncbi:DUF536 domain-containing protein [Carnobacterium mobile]|uniref:DUF536 domain-containing protein n=1 Tax=Carnobacterium mobile TaxID=2750 RepID=UPI000552932B|nr:DUF536 domain-containing protein [Carnobacterium mobile]
MSNNRVQIIVRTTTEEKEKIKEIAKLKNKSMNQLIIDSVIDSANDSAKDSENDTVEDRSVIAIFNSQLENKDKQIDKLQNLLDQQQQLSLQSNKQMEQLQLQLSNETAEDLTRSVSNQLVNDEDVRETTEKKGFFSKIFKK